MAKIRLPEPSKEVIDRYIGLEYKRLLVKSFAYRKSRQYYFNCECNCGGSTIASINNLKKGNTNSCGCFHKEQASKVKAMFVHGKSGTRLHGIWTGMMSRCYNTKWTENYNRYGAKGISVFDEWHDFLIFEKWANDNGYQDDLTIDRIDNYKGYSPDNCRWATNREQANNKKNSRYIEHGGLKLTWAQWEQKLGYGHGLIFSRIKGGWDEIRAITTEPKRNL